MRLVRNGTTLLTGGADGVVMQWDVAKGSIADGCFAGPSITLKNQAGEIARTTASFNVAIYHWRHKVAGDVA